MKLLLILFLFLASCTGPYPSTTVDPERITKYTSLVRPLLKDTHNKEIIFFVDLQLHSGSARFFVIDLQTNLVLDRGLVCSGKIDRDGDVIFSNVPGSNTSSSGLYKIGKPYVGRFGKAYKLHGLDKTNSNAYRRFIVLHSYKWVPDKEGSAIFQSQGCPTVSPRFFATLDRYIKASDKPVMLYIR